VIELSAADWVILGPVMRREYPATRHMTLAQLQNAFARLSPPYKARVIALARNYAAQVRASRPAPVAPTRPVPARTGWVGTFRPTPSVPPPSVPPSQGGSTSADAGWAAYQASEGARTPGVHPTRAQHDRFWSSLTAEEKLAGLRFYALTQEQVASIRPEQDPSLASFFGKMMAFAFSLMSAASPPAPVSSDGSSPQMLGIGNYTY